MEPKDTTNYGVALVLPSVRELVKEPLTRIPPRYIHLDQDPPVLSSSLSSNPELPIIDMKRLLSPDSVDSELEKLHLACRDWGFFQLINHEVSSSLIEKVKEETQEFFKLPLDEKKKYAPKPGDFQGFGQLFVVSEEQKLDWADTFSMVTLPSHVRKPHLLPKLPQPFRDTIDEYSKEVEKVALRTLMFISKALKMEVEEMKSLYDNGLQIIRINYYPPCPQPEQVIGVTPHSDGSGITLLLQVNQADGLEIKKDGNWLPVTPHPNAFIVNIGDIMEMVTNGEYTSIEHRAVVNANKERLSIAAFVSPNVDGNIGPATSLITPEKPPRFRSVPLSDYFKNRLSKKLGVKTNIEQYYI